jgi:hypothetical protein
MVGIRSLFFRTQTGATAQVWLDETTGPEVPINMRPSTCPACARVHLVNRKTGKTLGKEK